MAKEFEPVSLQICAWLPLPVWEGFTMNLRAFPHVQSLSVREKLELVDDLWKSISSDLDAIEVTQEEKDILEERWSAFLQNPASALTVDQFKIQLHALRA